MLSLKSRGYVRENFAWRHYYWYLTNEGIQYLRDFLHLPPEIVPATLRKATKAPEAPKPWQRGGDDRRGGMGRGDVDRDSYRRGGPPRDDGKEVVMIVVEVWEEEMLTGIHTGVAVHL